MNQEKQATNELLPQSGELKVTVERTLSTAQPWLQLLGVFFVPSVSSFFILAILIVIIETLYLDLVDKKLFPVGGPTSFAAVWIAIQQAWNYWQRARFYSHRVKLNGASPSVTYRMDNEFLSIEDASGIERYRWPYINLGWVNQNRGIAELQVGSRTLYLVKKHISEKLFPTPSLA